MVARLLSVLFSALACNISIIHTKTLLVCRALLPQNLEQCLAQASVHWDFPSGPVVKNLPSNAGDTSYTPGQETRSPKLSLWATKENSHTSMKTRWSQKQNKKRWVLTDWRNIWKTRYSPGVRKIEHNQWLYISARWREELQIKPYQHTWLHKINKGREHTVMPSKMKN